MPESFYSRVAGGMQTSNPAAPAGAAQAPAPPSGGTSFYSRVSASSPQTTSPAGGLVTPNTPAMNAYDQTHLTSGPAYPAEGGGSQYRAFASTQTAGGGATAPVERSSSPGAASPLSAAAELLSLLGRPGNAVRVGLSHHNASDTDWSQKVKGFENEYHLPILPALFDKAFWQGAAKGITGEETRTSLDALRKAYPQFVEQHPTASGILAGIGDAATDPLMYTGAGLQEKIVTPVLKTAGAVAMGSPEALRAAEAFAPAIARLASTSKPALAAGAVARSFAGQFSIDAALSHLPQGQKATEAIRQFMGGKQVGQIENVQRVQKIFEGLANATPEEKATLAHILDSPTAAEAEAKTVRAATAAADATKQATAREAHLNYQAPAPWDEPQPMGGLADQVRFNMGVKPSTMPTAQWEHIQQLSRAADEEVSNLASRAADGTAGPGDFVADETLPVLQGEEAKMVRQTAAQAAQEGRVDEEILRMVAELKTETRPDMKALNASYLTELRNLKNKGVGSASNLEAREWAQAQLRADPGSAVSQYERSVNPAAAQPAGNAGRGVLYRALSNDDPVHLLSPDHDPFAFEPKSRIASLGGEQDQAARLLTAAHADYDRNVNALAEQLAKVQTGVNEQVRRDLWQRILQQGKITNYADGYLAELTRGIPSHLKAKSGGMTLDEMASALGYESDEALAREIRQVAGIGPVKARDVLGEATSLYESTGQGYHARQRIQALTDMRGSVSEELDRLRSLVATNPAAEAEAGAQEARYLEAERVAMQEGGTQAAQGAVQAGQTGYRYAGIPKELQHLVDPVMEKYGHLIPEFRQLTDEAYARARGIGLDLGYQEHYYPRLSRQGEPGQNALQTLWQRLTQDNQVLPTKEGQLAGALSGRPGFTNERTLDTLGDYAKYVESLSSPRHAVLDPGDALLTHMDQATHAERSLQLRDQLVSMGPDVAVRYDRVRDIPQGFQDMSGVPGWDKIAVQKNIGQVLEGVLLPKRRGPAGVLYDTVADRIKGATFYNPLVHGKNLAFRAAMEGQNPAVLAPEIWDEVQNIGPTMRKLIEHGGATEYRALGEAGAADEYVRARLANGTASRRDKVKAGLDSLHNSLWQYDKALRVQMAKELESQGVPWPDIARQVNQTFSKALDPTPANMWLKRAMFTPAWTFNNLAWNTRNMLNPRLLGYEHVLNSVNEAYTGHAREENPGNKEEYTALGFPGSDGKALFVNLNTPDKDLREVLRNPKDFATQRLAPIPHLGLELFSGNSRPGDPERGLNYDAPGAGGPLVGYGSNGFGPDVGLRTQAVARLVPQVAGWPVGTAISETANVLRSQNPLRDLALRLGGTYASDVNERQAKAYDLRDQINRQRQEIRARTLRQRRRDHPQN